MYTLIKFLLFYISLYNCSDNNFFKVTKKQYYNFFGGTVSSASGKHYIIELITLKDIPDLEFQCVYIQDHWLSEFQVYKNNQQWYDNYVEKNDILRLEFTLWFIPQVISEEQLHHKISETKNCTISNKIKEFNADCVIFFKINKNDHILCIDQLEQLPNKNHP